MGRDAYADEIESRDMENRETKFVKDHSQIDEDVFMGRKKKGGVNDSNNKVETDKR